MHQYGTGIPTRDRQVSSNKQRGVSAPAVAVDTGFPQVAQPSCFQLHNDPHSQLPGCGEIVSNHGFGYIAMIVLRLLTESPSVPI